MIQLRLMVAALVLSLVSTIATAPAADAATDRLPWGKTYWAVEDYWGVDCAECAGIRVLSRISRTKARMAYLISLDNGGYDFACATIRLRPDGRWVNTAWSQRWTYRTQPKRLTVRDAAPRSDYWVRYRPTSKAATTALLRAGGFDLKSYRRCVG